MVTKQQPHGKNGRSIKHFSVALFQLPLALFHVKIYSVLKYTTYRN